MKNALTRLLALVALCALLPAAAMAEYAVMWLNLPGGTQGQHTETFYVSTQSGWFTSEEVYLQLGSSYISYDCSNHYGYGGSTMAYPAVEVKVWRFNSTYATWDLEQNYDVWNTANHTIRFEEENAVYKVQIYFWNVKTVADSYVRHGVLNAPYGGTVSSAKWEGSGPIIQVKPSNDVYLYEHCPISNME